MKNFILIICPILLSTQLAVSEIRRPPKADCHLRRVELCFSVFEKMKNGTDLSTSRGLDEVCIGSQEAMKCLKEYVHKCGTPLQREVADHVMGEFTHSIDRFCQPGKMREDFLKYSPCIVEKVLATKEYRQSCNVPFMMTVDGTNRVDLMDDRLSVACCAYNRWQDCLYKKIENHCQEGGKRAMVDFIEKTFGELPALVCPGSEFDIKSQKCQQYFVNASSDQLIKSSRNPITRYIMSHLSFLLNGY